MEIYKRYVERIAEATQDKWTVKSKSLTNGYDLLSLTINAGAKHSICFSAGIHGDEPAGPEAVLRFVESVPIPADLFVMIFPVVNPYGYNRHVRTNARRQDINRRFCDKTLSDEAKFVYRTIRENPVGLFCSLHEWSGFDGFYMYASDKARKDEIVEIPKIASKWFTVFDDKKVNCEDVEQGIIWHPENGYKDTRSKCTLENRMLADNVHYLCIETPSRADLRERTECQFNIMKYIIKNI